MCLFKLFQQKSQAPPQPTSIKSSLSATGSEVRAILHQFLPEGEIHISDNDMYLLVSPKDLDQFLSDDQTDRLEYQDETLDCDDFAAILYGNSNKPPYNALAWGLLWTDVHAMFIAVMEDSTVRFVEPQNDKYTIHMEPYQGSKVRFAIV